MKKMFDSTNLDDDLDIMDLDEEDISYGNNIEKDELEGADIKEEDGLDEEFVAEEPYVVPVSLEEIEPDKKTPEVAEEYDDAEEAFERKNSKKEREKKAGFMVGLFGRLAHMDTMDKIIVSLGCIVLVLAIVALSIFSSYRSVEGQMLTFADAGKNLENITLIGESGLLAVTDATMAKIDALSEVEEEEEEEEEELHFYPERFEN